METAAIHVLLVEDSPTDADLFRKMFIRSGKRGDLMQVERLSQLLMPVINKLLMWSC